MRHPSAPADPAPSQLARRLVLGAAFLIGLAFALVPRTADRSRAGAEDRGAGTKAASPAPKSQAQSASKSVTITDGRGQKIEIRKEGDAAAKGSETPGSPRMTRIRRAPASPARVAAITIGKGRIQIDGLGDKEFDSVGEFVQDEPEIAGMVVAIVTVIFLSPVLMIALVLWYRMRKTRMLNETMLKLAEKGIVTSSDALEALAGGKQAAAVATAPPPLRRCRNRRSRCAGAPRGPICAKGCSPRASGSR